MFSSNSQKDNTNVPKCWAIPLKVICFNWHFSSALLLSEKLTTMWSHKQHAHVLTRDHSVVIAMLLHETTATRSSFFVQLHKVSWLRRAQLWRCHVDKICPWRQTFIQTPGKALKLIDTNGLSRNAFSHSDFMLNEQCYTSSILPAPRGRRLFMLRTFSVLMSRKFVRYDRMDKCNFPSPG